MNSVKTIAGIFTVNNSGKKVQFTTGNLFWDGEKFGLEKHQYDYPSVRNGNRIGHFFWSKDVLQAVASKYHYDNTTTSDIFFAADSGALEEYTVLSASEWKYLINNALAKNSSSKITIVIEGKNCAVLKPDGFSGTVKDKYTAEEWASAESAWGLVALPFAGSCTPLGSIYGLNADGFYWAATPGAEKARDAWYAQFYDDNAFTYSNFRDNGHSIRLVRIIELSSSETKSDTDLKHLADLDSNGNWVRFLRGNDGDLHIVMATADEMTPEKYKGIMHSVRVGVGNSGGQEVPSYVKKALSDLVSAFEKWENEH